MNDSNNANNELVAEVVELRRRITELETQHREHEASESELKTARDRFEYLLAFSPAIIYTTQSSG